MKICKAKEIVDKYGRNTTLGDFFRLLQGDKIFKCSKCKGTGTIREKYNAYPNGFPDSGYVDDWKYRNVQCDLCNGEGYTNKIVRVDDK